MRLEQMFPNFLLMCLPEQEHFIQNYRARRADDLQVSVKARAVKTKPVSQFSKEDMALLKELGITKKALAELKSLAKQEEDDDEGLLNDSPFDLPPEES